jgi:hypothetical protein
VKASGKMLLEQDFSGWENEKWQTGTLDDVNTLWDLPPEAGADYVNDIRGVKEKRMLLSKRGMLVEIKKGAPRRLKCSIMETARPSHSEQELAHWLSMEFITRMH